MQAAGLQDSVKTNKQILIRAINTASFLVDECPHKYSKLSNNDLFYGTNRKPKVYPEHFVQWGRIGLVANKRSHTTKMKANGTAMLFVGYALNHPSGTYEFYNPNTDSIIISNSVKWKDFTRWEAKRIDSTVGKLFNTNSPDYVIDSDSDDDLEDLDLDPNPPVSTKTTTFAEDDIIILDSPEPP